MAEIPQGAPNEEAPKNTRPEKPSKRAKKNASAEDGATHRRFLDKKGCVGGRFSKEESEKVRAAVHEFIRAQGWTAEDGLSTMQSLRVPGTRVKAKVPPFVWAKVAELAGLNHRPVVAIMRHANRTTLREGARKGAYSENETVAIREHSEQHGHRWEDLGRELNRNPEGVRDHFRNMGSKRGSGGELHFTPAENDALAAAVAVVTRAAIPLEGIPWAEVKKKMDSKRGERQLARHWYRFMCPRLLEYRVRGEGKGEEDGAGLPVGERVFDRELVRRLVRMMDECQVPMEERFVPWKDCLPHFPAWLVRQRFCRLEKEVEHEEDLSWRQRVRLLFDLLDCAKHSAADEAVLTCAMAQVKSLTSEMERQLDLLFTGVAEPAEDLEHVEDVEASVDDVPIAALAAQQGGSPRAAAATAGRHRRAPDGGTESATAAAGRGAEATGSGRQGRSEPGKQAVFGLPDSERRVGSGNAEGSARQGGRERVKVEDARRMGRKRKREKWKGESEEKEECGESEEEEEAQKKEKKQKKHKEIETECVENEVEEEVQKKEEKKKKHRNIDTECVKSEVEEEVQKKEEKRKKHRKIETECAETEVEKKVRKKEKKKKRHREIDSECAETEVEKKVRKKEKKKKKHREAGA